MKKAIREKDYVERSNMGTKLRHPKPSFSSGQPNPRVNSLPSETELNYLTNLTIHADIIQILIVWRPRDDRMPGKKIYLSDKNS